MKLTTRLYLMSRLGMSEAIRFSLFLWRNSPSRTRAASLLRFLEHIQYTPQSVGLFWTSDRPVAETCASQYITITKDIHPPGGIFFFVFSCTPYFIRTSFRVLIVLHFAFLSLLPTHNTNIRVPGGIRTLNPSKRRAADPRLRPLGHWDRRSNNFTSPDNVKNALMENLPLRVCRCST